MVDRLCIKTINYFKIIFLLLKLSSSNKQKYNMRESVSYTELLFRVELFFEIFLFFVYFNHLKSFLTIHKPSHLTDEEKVTI